MKLERTALLAYPREWVYELVNDVERYPEYIEGVQSVRMIDQGSDDDGEFLTAELQVSKFGIGATFATSNRMQSPEWIQLKLHSGALKSLTGRWQFESLAQGKATKVSVVIEFEAGRLLASAAQKVADVLCGSVIDALERRLEKLHGKPTF